MDVHLHAKLNQTTFVLEEQLRESWHQAPDNECIIILTKNVLEEFNKSLLEGSLLLVERYSKVNFVQMARELSWNTKQAAIKNWIKI